MLNQNSILTGNQFNQNTSINNSYVNTSNDHLLKTIVYHPLQEGKLSHNNQSASMFQPAQFDYSKLKTSEM